ncbi:hypothetical protein I305_02403 [Cryptococcus gattii E566]|uniref:Uncharacterized protein n=2 Tax=Cryptococcus gattii TaxID=37769 RepID=E6RBC8_CRYGW|nr:Hypothetical Protein CGB_H5280W [Cryptococcus gattii WM276]ADV24116.1 Hypothetical Protein CGB_H5280W [Cryptococcus gattii WM276]KIR81220.1 hypothetical protein I306_01706 [Cryptococcus gattii EJB2]KIY34844.1 hypothetical protein I305_02403 [Cryptococcus gattii E566]
MKCTVPRNLLYSSAICSPRNGAEHSESMLAQQREFLKQFEEAPQTARQPHIARRAGRQTQATRAAVDTVEKSIFEVPGHLSVFDLFPNFDKVLHAVVDPMHALLEGVLPFYIRRVCILGRYCASPPAGWEMDDDRGSVASLNLEDEGFEDVVDRIMERGRELEDPTTMERLHQYAASAFPPGKTDGKPVLAKKLLPRLEEMMEKVIFPPYIDKIGKGFFTKQSRPTAGQWRTFAELLGPLIFPWLWAEEATAGRPLPQEELATCLKLFAVVRGTLQSAISESQVDRLRILINDFRDLVARLHPFLPSHVTNFHVIQHIPDDILSHGPVYGWWLFALKRLNGRIKHINMSGGNIFQEQVVELRALLRQRMALFRLKNAVHSEVDLTHEELQEELVEGFKLGGIDLTDDNPADDLHLYDNSGLDQEFSIDLLIKGSRSIEARPDKAVFENFMILLRQQNTSGSNGTQSASDSFYFHTKLAVRGYLFRPLDPTFTKSWSLDATREIPYLLQKKHACSFVECRPPLRRFADFHEATMTGILWTVFTHIRQGTDGRLVSREMWGVFRWLKWSSARDFGFNQEETLDIQVFRDNELSKPFFYPINDRTIRSIHPVALVRIPQKPADSNGPSVVVTIPIARHT